MSSSIFEFNQLEGHALRISTMAYEVFTGNIACGFVEHEMSLDFPEMSRTHPGGIAVLFRTRSDKRYRVSGRYWKHEDRTSWIFANVNLFEGDDPSQPPVHPIRFLTDESGFADLTRGVQVADSPTESHASWTGTGFIDRHRDSLYGGVDRIKVSFQ